MKRYHVLGCGYSIKYKPHYPEGLYQLLDGSKGMVVEFPFKNFNEYTRCVFESLRGVNVIFKFFNFLITNINLYRAPLDAISYTRKSRTTELPDTKIRLMQKMMESLLAPLPMLQSIRIHVMQQWWTIEATRYPQIHIWLHSQHQKC